MLKASFLLLLTFLLFINFNTVCVDAQVADDSPDATEDSTDATSNGSDDGDDDDTDSDSMDVTGESSDNDGDSDDDDSDSMSATGDSDDSDDDDSTSGESDDDDSGDSDDDDSTTSGDDDSDDSDDDSSSNGGGGAATTANPTAYCAQLTSSECGNAYANDGSAICAVNAVSQNCYAVVASSGIYGSGNYDDGFTAAQQSAEQESQKLNTIVGVLAGIITVMALGIIGGAYYLHTKSKRMIQEQELETVQSTTAMETADAEPML